MNNLELFLPCAAGVEAFLVPEVERVCPGLATQASRSGVRLQATWRDALQLNLHSRLAQRVLVQVAHARYQQEADLYDAASAVAWEIWFSPRQSFKVDITAQHSPLKSLNFAALKIKDAVCDRFRAKANGIRPDVNTQWPDVRVYAHLTADMLTLYIDTSGEPLFKRGWREDKGDAPLKETLAAAMIAASGWNPDGDLPLYDPCCGSGTVVIEAAQMACHIAPGLERRFAFEKLMPFQPHVWSALKEEARKQVRECSVGLFGSDISHRMVDFAQRNAERAKVAHAIQFRGGDALQRLSPSGQPGVILMNPPYGERIETAGVAGSRTRGLQWPKAGSGRLVPAARQSPIVSEGMAQAGDDSSQFFSQLAAHWKKHFAGWSAWVLTPDLKLPGKMRFKESRRVPMWNGPIECRLFRFDLVAGSARKDAGVESGPENPQPMPPVQP